MSEQWGNHVAIAVEGVLKHPSDNSVIIPGLLLYKSFNKDHRVSLLFDSNNKEKIQYWLIMNGLTEHIGEVYWEDHDSDDKVKRRLAQINRLRAKGNLSLVYEADTDCATALLNAGVPTMLFLHPQYAHPEFHPKFHNEATPWQKLLAEKTRQQEARAMDTRLNEF